MQYIVEAQKSIRYLNILKNLVFKNFNLLKQHISTKFNNTFNMNCPKLFIIQ